MREHHMRIVHGLRTSVYIALIVLAIILQIKGTATASEKKAVISGSETAFWPPDIVPHPHPPSEPEKEDEMSEYDAESYCGRCGWAIVNGSCTNPNCNQYGPNKD